MGYATDFTGSVTVEPPLNAAEADYLRRFADSRRFTRTDGPYALHEDGFRGPRTVDYNRHSDGQPSLWCNWTPTADGTNVEWNGAEKFYDSAEWMQYLIDVFLKDGAWLRAELASPVSGRYYDPAFAEFTFDHTVNGAIDAQGEDDEDTWRLVVDNNAVTKVVLPEPDDDRARKLAAQVADAKEPTEFTPRGFAIYGRIEDSRGGTLRIQESSAAEDSYVWLFAEGRHDSEVGHASIHLGVDGAVELRDALNSFLKDRGDLAAETTEGR